MHARKNMCTTSDGEPTRSRRLERPSCVYISIILKWIIKKSGCGPNSFGS